MAEVIGIEREIDPDPILGGANLEKPVRLADLPKSDAAVKAHAIGPQAIEETIKPQGKIAKEKVTLPPANIGEVGNVAWKAGVVPEKRGVADSTFAVIQIALAREEFGTQKLKALSGQVKELLANIELLLDLSSELTALPDKESLEMTPKMKDLLAKLEAQKIHIWSGGEKITKDKVSEMKAQVSSQIDKLRTALQTKISTEIQPEVNNLQSIMNIVQQIIRTSSRLAEKANQLHR